MSRRPIIRLLSSRLALPARYYHHKMPVLEYHKLPVFEHHEMPIFEHHEMPVFGHHKMPALEHESQFSNGIPGFLTRAALQMAWYDKQMDLLIRLNEKVSGALLEADSLRTLIIKVAREPDQTPIFNLASLAFNNKFFFDGLTAEEVPIERESSLVEKIEHSFSSVESFRQTFLDTALSMFGPGFVWLVKADASRLRIMNTYLAGTPFSQAHWKNQEADVSSIPAASPLANEYFMKNTRSQAGGMGFSTGRKGAPGGVDIEPLLCLNTWEYVWLRDYGVGMAGKEDYVNNWWKHVDWHTVSEAARPNAFFDR